MRGLSNLEQGEQVRPSDAIGMRPERRSARARVRPSQQDVRVVKYAIAPAPVLGAVPYHGQLGQTISSDRVAPGCQLIRRFLPS